MSRALLLIVFCCVPACVDFGAERPLDAGDGGVSADAQPDADRDAELAADAGAADGSPDASASPDAIVFEDADVPPDSGVCVEGEVAQQPDGGAEVRVTGFNLDNPTITVRAGDTVTWRLNSGEHGFRSGAPGNPVPVSRGGFNTGELGPGESYTHRFCTARTVIYYCFSHPSTMRDFSVVIE